MSAASPLPAWTPPREVEEYRLLQLLGRGVSGLVYLAQDTLLERLVALKFMLAVDADAVGRFLVEARATARLSHPNVLTLYRVGQIDDRPFLVSEFVRGTSLAQAKKPMPLPEALQIGVGIARGLAAAHRRGVLHRDIKPGNIMIDASGAVKVLDFGLAKLDAAAPGPTPAAGGNVASGRTPAAGVPTIVLPELTRKDAYIGTPFYMAPELWRREPATRRSDVYSLGAVLYELCNGRAPHGDVVPAELPAAAQSRRPPPCASFHPHADARFVAFAELIDRCLTSDPTERFASAEELLDGLEALSRPGSTARPPSGNPYRGLQPFGGEHRALFFGRSSEIAAVVERLRADPFVLVVGDSGVGKSSLVAAGVLPSIVDGALGDGRRWSSATLKPGRTPLATLTALLSPMVDLDEAALARELRTEPLAFSRRLRAWLRAERGLVLFVDQLEELLTLAAPDEADAFARILAELGCGILGMRLVATVRSDFLLRAAALPELGDQLSRALYLLRPLTESGICAAIVEPARATDADFDSPLLIESLVQSTIRTAGGLPLLQFTLAQLWDARELPDGILSRRALERIGGLAGALERHADEVLRSMLPDERQAARRILVRLVTVENTRAVRPRGELAASRAAEGALDALVRGRLVVVRDGEGGTTYEVAHEALISGWHTLKRWLAEELALRTAHQRLEAAAREWERLRRPDSALWGAQQQAEVERLDRSLLDPLEVAFLDASLASWRRARRNRLALAIGGPLIVAAVYAGFAASAHYATSRQVRRALAQASAERSRAQQSAHELAAIEQRAFAAFDDFDLVAGERAWSEALVLAATIDDGYGRAAEALEKASVLDGTRRSVRRATAELIAERASFDQERGRPVAERATLQRIALYDPEVAQRFVTPVRLRVTTTPAATVRLLRIDREHQYRVLPIDAAGHDGAYALPPGSYLVEAAAPGRATVRAPVLLRRGRDQSLALTLPAAGAIPAGFAYVPASGFLFGASGDESMRREFYRTVPLHERRTPAFLVARHETTFAEWIAFLEALPPGERARRLPKVAARGFHGAVALEEGAAGWHLRFQVTTREYAADRGEKIEYESRRSARAQDWLQFPVSGIAWDDVVAYTQWLSRSGRVPGARPCREDEWEHAVRGADGRAFPHGDDLAPADANWEATYDKQPLAFGPDQVGLHPASNSPFGLADAAGNVWEWTESVLRRGERVARGGSFYFPTPSARSANREPIEPTLRDLTIGVRVCADPTS